MIFIVFICINELGAPRFLLLFDVKKKEPSAAASRGKTVAYGKQISYQNSNRLNNKVTSSKFEQKRVINTLIKCINAFLFRLNRVFNSLRDRFEKTI